MWDHDAIARHVEDGSAGLDLIGLAQRVADRMATRGEEREAHPAADREAIDDLQQRVDHPELVAHLRTAQHGDERATGALTQTQQHVDLTREQPSGRARQRRRRTDDRRVRPVGRPECVVDVRVHAGDEPGDEGGVVRLLTRVEAEVLEQLDARRQLVQSRSHRFHRPAWIGRALRAPEV